MYEIDELKNYLSDLYENWYVYVFFHGEGLYAIKIISFKKIFFSNKFENSPIIARFQMYIWYNMKF